MDPRPPPPVTIEGGPGWTLDPSEHETVAGAPEDDVPGRAGRGRQLTALLVAAAVGFGAATLLAERRQSSLADSPEGVLSLDPTGQELGFSSDLVPLDGGLAVQVSVPLRNTGPLPVALESAELLGTDYAADDLAGRRVPANGGTTVRLLRPVRCDDLAPSGPVGPLRVRAMTGAGERTTELRLKTQGIAFSSNFARAACGLLPPDQSLVAIETAATRVEGGRAQVSVELSSASAEALVVQSLELPPGLRLASLQGAAGIDVALPLRLPPGDYDPPTDPMRGRGQPQRLVAVLEVADCAALPARSGDLYQPLFQATVTDERDRSEGEGPQDFYGGFGPGGSSWGDPTVVDRLREAACPARESALTTVPPDPSSAGLPSRG